LPIFPTPNFAIGDHWNMEFLADFTNFFPVDTISAITIRFGAAVNRNFGGATLLHRVSNVVSKVGGIPA